MGLMRRIREVGSGICGLSFLGRRFSFGEFFSASFAFMGEL